MAEVTLFGERQVKKSLHFNENDYELVFDGRMSVDEWVTNWNDLGGGNAEDLHGYDYWVQMQSDEAINMYLSFYIAKSCGIGISETLKIQSGILLNPADIPHGSHISSLPPLFNGVEVEQLGSGGFVDNGLSCRYDRDNYTSPYSVFGDELYPLRNQDSLYFAFKYKMSGKDLMINCRGLNLTMSVGRHTTDAMPEIKIWKKSTDNAPVVMVEV